MQVAYFIYYPFLGNPVKVLEFTNDYVTLKIISPCITARSLNTGKESFHSYSNLLKLENMLLLHVISFLNNVYVKSFKKNTNLHNCIQKMYLCAVEGKLLMKLVKTKLIEMK